MCASRTARGDRGLFRRRTLCVGRSGALIDRDAASRELLHDDRGARVALLRELERPPRDRIKLGAHALGLLDGRLLILPDRDQVPALADQAERVETERQEHRERQEDQRQAPGVARWFVAGPELFGGGSAHATSAGPVARPEPSADLATRPRPC